VVVAGGVERDQEQVRPAAVAGRQEQQQRDGPADPDGSAVGCAGLTLEDGRRHYARRVAFGAP